MSGNIRSTVGNFFKTTGSSITNLLSTVSSRIEASVGSVSTCFNSLVDGGFVGMSAQGMDTLKDALSKYCDEIETTIASFDQQGDITMALKGDVQTAAYEFIAAIKELLQAYVSQLRLEIVTVTEAYNNFASADKSISTDVTEAAAEIRSNASSIRID